MATRTTNPNAIQPIEWTRLLIGSIAFIASIIALSYFKSLNIITIIVAFFAISVVIGLLTNLERLKLTASLLAPFVGIVWLIINFFIAVAKVLIFFISGFDSEHIIARLSFLKFPEKFKTKTDSVDLFAFLPGCTIACTALIAIILNLHSIINIILIGTISFYVLFILIESFLSAYDMFKRNW